MYIWIWMEGSSETTPKIALQILYKTTRQMLTCGNLENINQILTLSFLSWCIMGIKASTVCVIESSYVTSEAERI